MPQPAVPGGLGACKLRYKACSAPAQRTKKACPSLGHLIPLLAISPSYTWRHLGPAYVEESFDRSVIWNAQKFPELAKTRGTGATGADLERLQKTIQASRVSQRLAMFHVYFVTQIARPAGATLADAFDRLNVFMGRPSLAVRVRFQAAVKGILAVNTWSQYFAAMQLPCPSPAHLTTVLEAAVRHSLDKGYHSKATRFDRIHRSGVSKILLKGESYSAAPDLRQLRLDERWKWVGDNTQYLDATCLAYAFNRKWVSTVDYSMRGGSHDGTKGAVRHSGDVLDYDRKSGTHTINVNLSSLPHNVQTLYFAVSAFAGAKLGDIIQPSVHLIDSTAGHGAMELCSYEVEDLEESNARKTAVLMCALRRERVGGVWKCIAIGLPTYGSACDYRRLQETIAEWDFKAQCAELKQEEEKAGAESKHAIS